MKNIHGKYVWYGIFMCLFALRLSGADSDVAYNLTVSNRNPYVKEAVTIIFDVKQKRPEGVISFEFHPVKSDDYELLFLGEEQLHDRDKRNHVRFRYALFPKRAGEVSVAWHFVTKTASTEEMKEVAIGARNVLRVARTKDRVIRVPQTKLHVRALPEGVQLVGAYTLSAVPPPHEALPFSQVDLHYTLEGYGYPPQIARLLPNIPGVEAFVEVESSDDKLFHRRRYRYALLSEGNFTVPAVTIEAFDPKRQKRYRLHSEPCTVTMLPVDIKALTDSEERPESALWGVRQQRYVYYILFFVAGFLSAKMMPMLMQRLSRRGARADLFMEKVARERDPKRLMRMLLAEDPRRYTEEIEAIEKLLYGGGERSFREIRRRIMQKATHEA